MNSLFLVNLDPQLHQFGHAFLRHAGRSITGKEEPTGMALSLEPNGERAMFGGAFGDLQTAVVVMIVHQLLESSVPETGAGIPDEPQLRQQGFPFLGEGGMFVFPFELVLMALSLDPFGQRSIFSPEVGNIAITASSLVLDQFLIAFLPSRRLLASMM